MRHISQVQRGGGESTTTIKDDFQTVKGNLRMVINRAEEEIRSKQAFIEICEAQFRLIEWEEKLYEATLKKTIKEKTS